MFIYFFPMEIKSIDYCLLNEFFRGFKQWAKIRILAVELLEK